jgi:hypothetical protein
MSGFRRPARWRWQGTHRGDPRRPGASVFATSRDFTNPTAQEISMHITTLAADAAPRTDIAELGVVGETLSRDEIELVAGGVAVDFSVTPQTTCPHTRPLYDDFTCLGGWLD